MFIRHARNYLRQNALPCSAERKIEEKLSVMEDAFWQSHDKVYCNSMESRLMSGYESPSTDYWQEACRLKKEVSELILIYKDKISLLKLPAK